MEPLAVVDALTCIVPFADLTLADLPRVGGKNASLGEMIGSLTAAGVQVPDGFAVTVDAYREHLRQAQQQRGRAF